MKDDEKRELGFLASVAANCFVFAALSGWIAFSHFGDWLGHVAGTGTAFLVIEGVIFVRRYRSRSRELQH